ncbi:cystatin-1-like isoform X1 [Stegodyphus dumicola]|uniref:cystatin-1-like isoform X1 n=1 Tax=Stegodyphus dumicola TaxID=202533 RepID=UPI0015AC2498|nr:cystatin-1-like isoform X1 [Stegodyphus dumicola]
MEKFTALIILNFFCGTLAMMTGGWKEIDKNSPEVAKHAQFATNKISASSNSLYHLKPVEILKAESQVVSGINYRMTIKMAPTECKKNSSNNSDLSQCDLLKCEAPMICNVTVWVQAWRENGTKLTKSSCEPGERPC